MECRTIALALRMLLEGRSEGIGYNVIDCLESLGLVRVMSAADYGLAKEKVDGLRNLENELLLQRKILDNSESQAARLYGLLGSRTHRIFSSRERIGAEESSLAYAQKRRDEARETISFLEGRLSERDASRQSLESYIRAGEGYVARTEAAAPFLDKIGCRLQRHGASAVDALLLEIDRFHAAFDSAVLRFYHLHKQLCHMYEDNSHIRAAGQILSCWEYDEPKLIERFIEISKLLDAAGWKGYHQAVFDAYLSGRADISPKEAAERMVSAHKALVDIGYADDYHTAHAALIALKHDRDIGFAQMQKDIEQAFTYMRRVGWDYKPMNAPVAAVMMLMPDPYAAVMRTEDIYDELVARRFPKGLDTGRLAACLLASDASPRQAAERFANIQSLLAKPGKPWASDAGERPMSCAVLSLLPGSPEEIVEYAGYTIDRLSDRGISRSLPELAAGILASSYSCLSGEISMPAAGIVPGNEHQAAYFASICDLLWVY